MIGYWRWHIGTLGWWPEPRSVRSPRAVETAGPTWTSRSGSRTACPLTAELERSLDAVHLFDLPLLSTVYRVFLLPGSLQVDLSFTPGAEFGPLGPRFALLFGTAVERQQPPGATARHLFELPVHQAVRGVVLRRAWPAVAGRVLDQRRARPGARSRLPAPRAGGRLRPWVRPAARAEDAMVRAIERRELLRALGSAVEVLLIETGELPDLAARVADRGLTADGWS